MDGLGAINTRAIKFRIVGPTEPALLTGANKDGSDLGDDALNFVLMPVRLSN